jgi:hypothetical protein
VLQSSLAVIRRFPYMFDGEHAGRVLFHGWMSAFQVACRDIDLLLPPGKLGFRWVRLGEKDGAAWFVYALSERRSYVLDVERESRRAMTVAASDAPDDLCSEIDGIVLQAELATSRQCMVCGQKCEGARYFGRLLVLCDDHDPRAANEEREEGLEGIWRQSIEWEDD